MTTILLILALAAVLTAVVGATIRLVLHDGFSTHPPESHRHDRDSLPPGTVLH